MITMTQFCVSLLARWERWLKYATPLIILETRTLLGCYSVTGWKGLSRAFIDALHVDFCSISVPFPGADGLDQGVADKTAADQP